MAARLDEVFIIPPVQSRAKHWRASIKLVNAHAGFHADGIEQMLRLLRSLLRSGATRT